MDYLISIKNHIGDLNQVKNDKDLIVALSILKCVDLLESVSLLLENQKVSSIPALLRLVYEYTFVIVGIDESNSIDKFINQGDKNNYGKSVAVDASKQMKHDYDKFDQIIFQSMCEAIYSKLSVHCHSNIDNLIQFVSNEYSPSETQEIFHNDMKIMFEVINTLFVNSVVKIMKMNIEPIKLNIKELIGKMVVVMQNHIETNQIQKKILSIESVRNIYMERQKELSSSMGEFKNIMSIIKKDNI